MKHYLFAIEWSGSMNRKSLRIFHTFDEVISHIHSDAEIAKSVYSSFYRVYEITNKPKNIGKQIDKLLGINHDSSIEAIRDNRLPDNEYTRSMKEPEDA